MGVEPPSLRESLRLIADSIKLFNTGIALVDPDEAERSTVSATVQLVDPQGRFVSSKQLSPGRLELTDLVFTELFDDVPGIDEFEGILRISSDELLAPLCLRRE